MLIFFFFSELDTLTQIPVQASPVGYDGEQTRMHVECGLDKDAYLLPNSPVRWAISPPKEREGVREKRGKERPKRDGILAR